MPNDATMEILSDLQNKAEEIYSMINEPYYNIDEMDGKDCMASLKFSGCYAFLCAKEVDSNVPGMVYIDGQPTESPILVKDRMFGQMIGVNIRKYIFDYNRRYHVCYTGAADKEGNRLPDYEFYLTTFPRKNVGEEWKNHDAIVLKAARESAVLLKNKNYALPLGKNAVVNPIGAGAVVYRSGCLGAGKINPRYAIRVKEGIEKYSSLILNDELYQFYITEKNEMPSAEIIERARQLNDTAVIFITRTSSEAHDNLPEKGAYYLTDEERTIIRECAKIFAKSIVILNVAYPIEMGWEDEYDVDAVLLTGLPGMAGGAALAEILEGRTNPSGRLPNTWAYDYNDYSTAANFVYEYKGIADKVYLTTVYEEGIYMGYRYFDTFDKKPAYRFGHGLSYTTFEKKVTSIKVCKNCLTLDVCIKNTGEYAGKEVIQIYAQIPDGKFEQPKLRLVTFAKTDLLQPGEEETLHLMINENRLSTYDTQNAEWILEAGKVDIIFENQCIYTYDISKNKVIKKAGAKIPCPIEIRELSKKDPLHTWPEGKKSRIYEQDDLPFQVFRSDIYEETELKKNSQDMITFPDVKANPQLLEDFVAQLSNHELARLCVGRKTGWGIGDSGYAGMFYNCGEIGKYKIPDYYYTDGNNGVNLKKPNIGFPVSSTMCASWNEDLLYEEGKAIAGEAVEFGMQCVLAPALNLQRNPLCGRYCEYFSEDPLLAGRMAGQELRGLEENGVSGSVKHFFGNNAETLRNTNHSLMSERTARELYIRAFEYAFEVKKPDTVMTGYNAANGMYCSNDKALLKGILRGEMEFEGYVMTDWGGFGNQNMDGLMNAGISWIAPGSEDDTFTKPIEAAMEKGQLTRAAMQQNVIRLMKILIKHG